MNEASIRSRSFPARSVREDRLRQHLTSSTAPTPPRR
jgi:hypothetical protein